MLIKQNINRSLIRIMICLFLTFSLAVLPGKNAYSQEDESLDDIINGFDNDSSEDASHDNQSNAAEEADKIEKDRISDDILDGFDDDGEDASAVSAEKKSRPSIFSFDGYLKLGSSYNIFNHNAQNTGKTNWHGLSRLLVESRLELSAKFSKSWQALISGRSAYDFAYLIRGRDEFTDDVLDAYEMEYELCDAYLLGSPLSTLDIKAGRQIVVWGRSDNIRVTDVLNPLDMREPGITDIENLRLPVTMTRIDYYIGDWSITGIALHEIRFDKIPEYGSDFYPSPIPQPGKDMPKHGGKDTEYAAALNAIFSKWDFSLYWANIFNDIPYVEIVSLKQKHARLHMFGAATNVALGNWLIKAEAAYFNGLEFYNNTGKNYSRIDALAGIEYSGFTDTTISIEGANRHINGFDSSLENPLDYANEDEFQSAIRLTRKFLNDTLQVTILASIFGIKGQDGAFQRLSAAYDIMDALELSGGVVLYQSGDLARLNNIGDNDRLFLEIKYSF